jgi:hypothetical protein
MNSSISNSEQLNTEHKTSRKVFGKAVFAIGLSMLSAMIIIRLILISMGANTQGVLGRVTESRAALTQIVKDPDELVMFFGSSMTQAGFSPRKFDAALADLDKNVTSFNYGFGGLNPYFQDFLSRRIVEDLEDNERRLTLTMIEFNPFQTTSTRWNRAKPVLDSFLTLLASAPELLEIAKQDITRGVRLFNIKYLRGNISAEMVTTFFGREIFPAQGGQKYKDDEETITERRRLGQLLNEQFDKEYPDYKDSEWSYEWQGAGTIPEERSAETMAIFDDYYKVSHTDARMKNDRLSRIRSADIEELHFEPLLVEHFINIIKNFQGVSDNLEVIMLPKNAKWIKTTPEADKRLAEAIMEIERATGVKVRNHQDISEITPSMYRDTTHLSRYKGDIAYTDYLIDQYAGLFK